MKDPRHVVLHLVPPTLQQATINPRLHQRLPDTHRQVWTVSCGVIALFSWVLVHKVLLCPLRVYFPVLCKFWQLCGGVNGDLLQKVPCMLCHTQCAHPCSRPPPTHTSARDSWPLRGKSGSVSCEVTAPFSWVLVCRRFCLCPPRVCFPSPV